MHTINTILAVDAVRTRIISNLDRAAFAALSTVCRGWRNHAQKLLYRNFLVGLPPPEHAERFENLVAFFKTNPRIA